MLVELAIVLLLIMANGVLAGAEIAVVSVRKTRLQALLDSGRSGARALAALRADPERFLATVQIGITVVSTTASAFGGSAVAAHLEPLFRPLPFVGPYAHDIALVSTGTILLDRIYDSLRSDPRFERILERMHLSQFQRP